VADLGAFLLVEVAKSSEVTVDFAAVAYNYVKGTVKVGGVVAPRRVVILDRRTLEYVSSCFSKADGTFEFKNLAEQGFHDYYVVIAFDDSRVYNADTMDFVKQASTTGG